MFLRKIEKHSFAGTLRPVVTLSAALVLSLTVLGGLSLRQHRQIQQLRQSNQEHNLPSRPGPSGSVQPSHLSSFSDPTNADRQYRSEEILSALSRGVCLIQGEYIFVEAKTDKPLRYVNPPGVPGIAQGNSTEMVSDVSPVVTEPILSVSIHGTGRVLNVPFTGTGFLVDKQGFILTNKHVTEPWLISHEYRHVLSAGYAGKLSVFRAFFGGYPDPFDVQVATVSETEDVALLRAELGGAEIPVLRCEPDRNRLKAGQTVIVLGYPTGFDALLARLSSPGAQSVAQDGGGSLEEIALTMAQQGLIWPIGTRGMCGRVSEDAIIYDAPTAIGGSGGPVLGLDGRVVAINTALMRGFSGTNFGIPVQAGLTLLEQAQKPEWQRESAGPGFEGAAVRY